jgi:hypothetical protein
MHKRSIVGLERWNRTPVNANGDTRFGDPGGLTNIDSI